MGDAKLCYEWFRIALLDLESAIFLKNMHPIPVEIICYHCQQSAEKMLKGYLCHNSCAIKKTHDLTILYKNCCDIDKSFEQIENQCINLTDFSVNTRYPYVLEITESDMLKAIDDAKAITDFVHKKIVG